MSNADIFLEIIGIVIAFQLFSLGRAAQKVVSDLRIITTEIELINIDIQALRGRLAPERMDYRPE
jgi:hypothetical protein